MSFLPRMWHQEFAVLPLALNADRLNLTSETLQSSQNLDFSCCFALLYFRFPLPQYVLIYTIIYKIIAPFSLDLFVIKFD